MDSKENICSVCGKHITEDNKQPLFFFSYNKEDFCICLDCVDKIHSKLSKNMETVIKTDDTKKKKKTGKTKPSDIKAYLDQYIIGQDKAKEILSVAICNHYKMCRLKKNGEENSIHKEMEKSNVLLVGPSGSGKTAMVKRLGNFLGVPVVTEDATSFSATGYVGRDIETILRDILDAADGDINKAERGIVFIDEVDKISRKGENLSTTSDPGNEAVQQGLLKMLEGNVVEVPKHGNRRHPDAEVIKINTENILFILGGAFEGIEKIIAQRHKRKAGGSIGIGAVIEDNDDAQTFNNNILDLKTEDLKKFGMLPEFLGRIPVICPMKELSIEALVSILTKPKNALVKQYQALMEDDGISLEFTENALRHVANKAMERKTGARSLRGVMEDIMNPIMFRIPDEQDIEKLVIDTDKDDNIKIDKKKKEAAA